MVKGAWRGLIIFGFNYLLVILEGSFPLNLKNMNKKKKIQDIIRLYIILGIVVIILWVLYLVAFVVFKVLMWAVIVIAGFLFLMLITEL